MDDLVRLLRKTLESDSDVCQVDQSSTGVTSDDDGTTSTTLTETLRGDEDLILKPGTPVVHRILPRRDEGHTLSRLGMVSYVSMTVSTVDGSWTPSISVPGPTRRLDVPPSSWLFFGFVGVCTLVTFFESTHRRGHWW